jgi:tRNA (cmo5U34)-methyltransferase
LPFERDEEFLFLDLGAGTGLLSGMVAERFPGSRGVLVDASVEMLRVARRRFAGEPAGRFRYVVMDYAREGLPRARSANGGSPDGLSAGGYDAVVSALSVHHLVDGDKRELFGKVYEVLRPGGGFVNADQVLGETAEEERRNGEDWLRQAREAGVGEADLAASLERQKADRNATLPAQLAWLEEAGFEGVRSMYKAGRFAVYAGRKEGREPEGQARAGTEGVCG